jgi:hypothetical protein
MFFLIFFFLPLLLLPMAVVFEGNEAAYFERLLGFHLLGCLDTCLNRWGQAIFHMKLFIVHTKGQFYCTGFWFGDGVDGLGFANMVIEDQFVWHFMRN